MDSIKNKRNWIIGGVVALFLIVGGAFLYNNANTKKNPTDTRVEQLKEAKKNKDAEKLYSDIKIGDTKKEKEKSDTYVVLESSLGKPQNQQENKKGKDVFKYVSWNSEDPKYSLTVSFKNGIATGKLLTTANYIKDHKDFDKKAMSIKAGMTTDEVAKTLGNPTSYQEASIDGVVNGNFAYNDSDKEKAVVYISFENGKATNITGTLFSKVQK